MPPISDTAQVSPPTGVSVWEISDQVALHAQPEVNLAPILSRGLTDRWFLEPWRALVREDYEVHYIVLRASKEETMKRAVERSKLDRKTNVELVETMWEQFCNLGIYESNVIETTTYSIQ